MNIDFKKEFPVLSQYTYANIAASGIMYKQLLNWRQEHDLNFLIKGSLFRNTHHEFIETVRETVADFFNYKAAFVSLIPNFSFGFNTLLDGLEKNQKVLLLENDYPSVNEAVEDRAFTVCYVAINEHLEVNIEQAIEREKPTILALSLVQYINGIKVEFDFLNHIKNKYPELLIIADGTQFCGTEKFDFNSSGIDILGASAYKWLLAGYGCGFMLFKEKSISKIFPKLFDSRKADVFSKEQQHLMHFFEPGHQDTLNYGSLKFSLEFLNKISIEVIEEKNKVLGIYAKEAFAELNLLEKDVINRKEHTTIFNISGNDDTLLKLQRANILCAQRGNGIRLSFHFFNTENDIDKIVNTLK